MKSATPKVLHSLAGRSLLGHAVVAARAVHPACLVVVVGHGRVQVTEHLAGVAEDALVAIQDAQLGTGHAVSCALEQVDIPDGTVVVDADLVSATDGAVAVPFSSTAERVARRAPCSVLCVRARTQA